MTEEPKVCSIRCLNYFVSREHLSYDTNYFFLWLEARFASYCKRSCFCQMKMTFFDDHERGNKSSGVDLCSMTVFCTKSFPCFMIGSSASV